MYKSRHSACLKSAFIVLQEAIKLMLPVYDVASLPFVVRFLPVLLHRTDISCNRKTQFNTVLARSQF